MKTKSEAATGKAGAGKAGAGKAAKAPEKKGPAAPATVDPETGIRLDKVKADVVDRYLKAFGLEAGGAIGDRLKRLAAWLLERVDKKRRAVCGTCGGRSDARLAACPFCGDEESDQKVDEAAAVAELRGAGVQPRSVAAGAPASKVEAKAAPPKAEKSAAPPKGGKEPKAAPAPAAAPASAPGGFAAWTAPGGAPAPAGGELGVLAGAIVTTPEKVAGTGGAEVVGALVLAKDGAAPLGTAEDLDASVARIRQLHISAIGNIYDLGGELFRCFSTKLHLRRTAPGSGDPVYESWTAFVSTELEDVCSVQYSYTLMRIAQAFPRELVLKPGMIKKLSLLLRVTDVELAKELEGKLDAGMTIKQLQDRVTEAVGTGQAAAARPAIEGGRGVRGPGNVAGRPADAPASAEEEEIRSPPSELTDDDLEGIKHDGLDSLPEPPAGKKPDAKKGSTHPFDVPDGGKGKASAAPAGKAPAAPPAQQKMCTVTLEFGRKKLPALARPVKGKDPKQAKRVADDPWFEEELPNGSRLVVKLVAGKKGLEFVREFLPAKDGK